MKLIVALNFEAILKKLWDKHGAPANNYIIVALRL